jgi:hypothetical protein
MRYLQLFELAPAASTPEIVAEPTATKLVAPVEAEPTKVYFHVTTKARLKSIQAVGIEPNHPRRWKTGTGRQLGHRGNIYLMSDFHAAVHWANKIQWERYNGKEPDPSPYVIICVRENPKALEPDPHPENGLYGKSWFQKSGKIEPQDIMKVIPLTPTLIQSVSESRMTEGDNVTGLGHNYSLRKCLKMLRLRGWLPTTTPMEFQNEEYPEYSIDLDINSALDGPFSVFRGSRKLSVTKMPPYAQQLALKDRVIDTPRF